MRLFWGYRIMHESGRHWLQPLYDDPELTEAQVNKAMRLPGGTDQIASEDFWRKAMKEGHQKNAGWGT